ncbi:hypothetical protein [Citrobacter braakii]|nr:hypothetical protein [Citrobacter braakii]
MAIEMSASHAAMLFLEKRRDTMLPLIGYFGASVSDLAFKCYIM